MDTVATVVEIDADLANLIPRYLNNCQGDLHFARRLLDNGDYWLLAGMAQRIRDSAASYRFEGLGEIAQAIGSAADRRDAEAVDASLRDFDAFIRSVRVEYI